VYARDVRELDGKEEVVVRSEPGNHHMRADVRQYFGPI
jgi:hypothetical protein